MLLLLQIAIVEEIVNVIVEGGAVPSLIKHLQPPTQNDSIQKPLPFEHEVEKGSAFALGLLAVKVLHFHLFSSPLLSRYLLLFYLCHSVRP